VRGPAQKDDRRGAGSVLAALAARARILAWPMLCSQDIHSVIDWIAAACQAWVRRSSYWGQEAPLLLAALVGARI
jgi:hypothetical protein